MTVLRRIEDALDGFYPETNFDLYVSSSFRAELEQSLTPWTNVDPVGMTPVEKLFLDHGSVAIKEIPEQIEDFVISPRSE